MKHTITKLHTPGAVLALDVLPIVYARALCPVIPYAPTPVPTLPLLAAPACNTLRLRSHRVPALIASASAP